MPPQWSFRRLQRGERLFLRAHDRGRFIRLICETCSNKNRISKHRYEVVRFKQTLVAGTFTSPGTAPGLALDVSGRCAHQTVAGNEVMVEERQRLVGSQR